MLPSRTLFSVGSVHVFPQYGLLASHFCHGKVLSCREDFCPDGVLKRLTFLCHGLTLAFYGSVFLWGGLQEAGKGAGHGSTGQ